NIPHSTAIAPTFEPHGTSPTSPTNMWPLNDFAYQIANDPSRSAMGRRDRSMFCLFRPLRVQQRPNETIDFESVLLNSGHYAASHVSITQLLHGPRQARRSKGRH